MQQELCQVQGRELERQLQSLAFGVYILGGWMRDKF